MRAPVVGVSGPRHGGRWAWGMSALAIRRAGGRPRRIRPGASQVRLEDLAAIVVGGGKHVEPTRYREEAFPGHVYDTERDELEWRLLDHAERHGLPILGICRGAQLLNVYHGGSLYQDVHRECPEISLRPTLLPRRPITILRGTCLARAMETTHSRVNSLHRQAIRLVGNGLIVSAVDHDGIVQAVELEHGSGRFVLGVQWHPEYLPGHPAHQRLFHAVVSAIAC